LGVLSLLLVIPAAFFYILIMLVREAALIILVATSPIAAGGLVSDVGKVWFWKTLRWFFSCLLISPCAALLLGIGVKLSEGAINQTPPPCAPNNCDNFDWLLAHSKAMSDWQHANNSSTAGMAIVGCIVIAIGAVCPLILFRLLAFVEPGTASGAALRQSWSDAGGMSGIMSGGGKQSSGSSAATASSSDGRSGGESGAESQTQGRLAAAMGAFGTGMQVATSIAHKAADLGSDVLGGAGVGSPGYSMTPTDERASRNGGGRSSSGGQGGGDQSGGQDGGGGTPPPSNPPEPPAPPDPTPAPKAPLGPSGGGGAAGAGEAGGAAGGGEAAAAAVAL
jgi:hypothetical protein